MKLDYKPYGINKQKSGTLGTKTWIYINDDFGFTAVNFLYDRELNLLYVFLPSDELPFFRYAGIIDLQEITLSELYGDYDPDDNE